MKAVFHIGRPKCGSTSLQVFLEDNRDALARHGVFYDRIDPEISSQWEFPIAALAERGAMAPDPYVRRLVGLDDLDAAKAYSSRMMRRFEDGLAGAPEGTHTWVASSEHVWPYMTKAGRITSMDDMLRKHFDTVTYVVYLRRQEDLVVSAYSEAVRRGSKTSFREFVDTFLETQRGNHMMPLRRWLYAVGPERLRVRILEPDALHGGDLVEDFCQILDLSAAGMQRPEAYNPSLTQDSMKAFRLINRGIASVETTDAWRHSLREALLPAAEHWGRNGEPLQLPQAQIERIRHRLEPSNEALREQFFPDRTELFPARPSKAAVASATEPSSALSTNAN